MKNEPLDPDILIAGGGIQGVTLLHELAAAGARRVLLASWGDLGAGETLHTHGYMHHGYMMSAATTAPLVREMQDCGAWWGERIRPPYLSAPDAYCAVAGQAAAERMETWNGLGLTYQPASEVPAALRGGEADGSGVLLFSIADRLVSLPDLLRDLSAPLQDHIVRARLTAIELDEGGARVTRCMLSASGGEIAVRPRILLLACGRGAQPLLRATRTPAGQRPLELQCTGLNRIRFLPMLLVRGRRLPPVTAFFETHAFWILTHPLAGDESMWIISPLDGHQTERGDFDPVRERIPGGEVVAETVRRLCALVPAARQRLSEDLRFSFYFGGKIDHPEGGNRRYLDNCGMANLRLAWPGLWSLSLANAREIVSQLQASSEFAAAFDPARPPLDLAAAGLARGASVGEELRLSNALSWHPWPEFKRLQEVP